MNNKKKMLLCIFNVSKLKVIIFLCLWFNELRIIFKDFKNTGSVYSFTQESEGRFNWSQPFRLGLYWLFEFLFILYWIKYQLIKTIILNMNKKWEKQILLFAIITHHLSMSHLHLRGSRPSTLRAAQTAVSALEE